MIHRTPTPSQLRRARERSAAYNLPLDEAIYQVMKMDAEDAEENRLDAQAREFGERF